MHAHVQALSAVLKSLVSLLVDKGILSDQEVTDLRANLAKEMKDSTLAVAPEAARIVEDLLKR